MLSGVWCLLRIASIMLCATSAYVTMVPWIRTFQTYGLLVSDHTHEELHDILYAPNTIAALWYCEVGGARGCLTALEDKSMRKGGGRLRKDDMDAMEGI